MYKGTADGTSNLIMNYFADVQTGNGFHGPRLLFTVMETVSGDSSFI